MWDVNNNKITLPLANEDVKLVQEQTGIPHLERYDLGLQDFLKNFFVGDVVITPVENFWSLYIKTTENDIKFPAVSFYPVDYSIPNTNSFSMQQKGFIMDKALTVKDPLTHDDNGTTILMSKFARSLNVDISYNINVWALNRSDALQLTQELMFPLFNHREFPISYYDEIHNVSFDIRDSVTDNSRFGMTQSSDVVYRYSFDIVVHAAIYDSKNYQNVVKPKSSVIE